MFPFACVSIPNAVLQIAQRNVGSDAAHPLIVVESDRPTARIEAFMPAAAEHGIRIGMRYTQALALCSAIQAVVVSAAEREEAQQLLRNALERVSPTVETAPGTVGVFWAATAGLERLFGPPERWAATVRELCAAHGFNAVVAHGWTRLGTLVAALERGTSANAPPPVHFSSSVEERRWAYTRALELLPLPARSRSILIEQLGIRRIGEFARLKPHHVQTRFDAQTVRLHRFVTHIEQLPVQSYRAREAIRIERECDPPLRRIPLLVEVCGDLVERCMARLSERGVWLTGVRITVHDEDGARHFERILTAQPTRNRTLVQQLVRLRFSTLRCAPVVRCAVELEVAEPVTEQGELIAPSERQCTAAAAGEVGTLVATLLAEFGTSAVLKAEVVEAHPIEQRARWEACSAEEWVERVTQIVENGAATCDPAVRIVRRVPVAPVPVEAHGVQHRWGPFFFSLEWWNTAAIPRIQEVWWHESGRLWWVSRARGSTHWELNGYG